jgi:Large polyvalent protein-associated domain 7
LDKRESHHRDRAAARIELREAQRDAWRDLAARHRQERDHLFDGSWCGKGDALNALRSVTAARQAQEKAELRKQQRTERAELRLERGRFPSYEEWLATGDRDAAQEWRHRVRRPASIEGPTFEQPIVRDIRACRAVIDGSQVHYYLGGGRQKPAFTDRGQRIDIFDGHNGENVVSALQLAAQKWGTVIVAGDERYKRLCAEVAAEYGFKIANPELAPAIAAERERLRRGNVPEHSPPPPDRTPRLLTPEAIYGRHLAEVVHQQQGRKIDPSRLDGEIAVRLATTGHSREGIATAIRDGASATRPGETRDWDLYARRAADFASSPPGMELRQRFLGQEDRLIELEGRKHEQELLRRLGGPMKYL